MKKLIPSIVVALIAIWPARAFGQTSLENDPAYLPIDKVIDFKTIHPEVNVNLPRFLLKDALSGLNGGADDPLARTGINLADVIKDVKLIRVVVIQAKGENRAALDSAVKTLRATLEAKWTSIVTVPQENVGVYALGDPSGESVAGLAVLVHDGGEVVIANVVGHVSIGKLIQIAGRMDKLPKDFLKQIGGIGGQSGAASAKTTTNEHKTAASNKADASKERAESPKSEAKAEPKKSDGK